MSETNETTGIKVQRNYKDRLFRLIFTEKKELLSLYNAVNGTSYTDPDDLEINTLENAIYMSMRNDLSFLIDSTLSLYEHQATYNPNLPLRNLFYVSGLYSNMTKDRNLYGSRIIELPNPKFVVFYNGQKEVPDRSILKLSDAFQVKDEDAELELTTIMLNINPGHNDGLLKDCKTLSDYVEFVRRVRYYVITMPLEKAVEKAIEECIKDDVLADFLRKHRSEAKAVTIFEYDEEKHMQQIREEGREEEREKQKKEAIRILIQTCKELGISKEDTQKKVMEKYSLTQEDIQEYMEEY